MKAAQAVRDKGAYRQGALRTAFFDRWFRKLGWFAGPRSGADIEATVVRIRGGVQLRGANLWILLCATIIASIGLNTSSAAVIIGAMLISPLMGPILGLGLGIAIHDRVMLLRALRTFGAAVVVSLLTSVLYFSITPITVPTPELLARTSPTLLDVGIAFFGGIAGIIAGSRREATTAIPGVAIATALMPPLCTAGYGLATGHWPFFWGALYLFFLNTVFISLATFLVVRLLRIPFVTYVDPRVERRVVRWIFIIMIVAIVPSVVLFYDVIADLRRKNSADRFVHRELEVQGRKALSWNLETSDSGDILKVYLAGPPMTPERVDSLAKQLVITGSEKSYLKVVQLNLPTKAEADIDPEKLLTLLRSADVRDEIVHTLKDSLSPPADTVPVTSIQQELRVLFPAIGEVTYSQQPPSAGDTTALRVHLFLVRGDTGNTVPFQPAELVRMQSFLRLRLQPDSVRVMDLAPPARARDTVKPARRNR